MNKPGHCRDGILIALGLFFLVGCAAPEGLAASRHHSWQSARRDFASLPGTIIKDSNDIFLRSDNAAALFLAAGASIAMHNTDADDNIADNFQRHPGFKDGYDRTF